MNEQDQYRLAPLPSPSASFYWDDSLTLEESIEREWVVFAMKDVHGEDFDHMCLALACYGPQLRLIV